MIKNIAANILAFCGCNILMYALYLTTLYIPSTSRYFAIIFYSVAFVLFCAANIRIFKSKRIWIRYISITLLSTILAYISFPACIVIFRIVYVMAGGNNDF